MLYRAFTKRKIVKKFHWTAVLYRAFTKEKL